MWLHSVQPSWILNVKLIRKFMWNTDVVSVFRDTLVIRIGFLGRDEINTLVDEEYQK